MIGLTVNWSSICAHRPAASDQIAQKSSLLHLYGEAKFQICENRSINHHHHHHHHHFILNTGHRVYRYTSSDFIFCRMLLIALDRQ